MASQFKFIIPQKLEDLLHPREDPNIFYVIDELTCMEIVERLPESERKLIDPLLIEEEFIVFFSVLKKFNELDSRYIDKAWTILFKVTSTFKEQLKEIFTVLNESVNSQIFDTSQGSVSQERANLFESVQEKLRHANALKMLIFLTCTFIQLFEDALASQSHRQNFNEPYSEATPSKGRKRQRRTNDNDQDISFKEYDRYKELVMRNLLMLISTPLNRVAESPTESKEIVGQAMRASYKMIENSVINNLSKSKDLMVAILGTGIQKYHQSLSFCLKFIQLLQYKEQLAPFLAEIVALIVTQHQQRLLIGELLREIDRIDIKELSRDSSCPRAISTFLKNLSEKCPQEFIPSLNHIFDYLGQDSYIMRNASLSIMGNLIINHLHKKEDEKQLRDELLDAILAHVKDIIGYTRSRALATWSLLCESQCIPLAYIVPVTSAAVARLNDKSCFVRKSASRFITTVLSMNPYARKLPLKVFLKSYETEKEILDSLMEKEEEVLETLSQNSQDDESITSETDPEAVHPTMGIKNVALAEESAIVAQRRKVNYLQDSIAFTRQIHKAIPLAAEMLISKNSTDIQEAIEFFVNCHEHGIDEALIGFKKMILLINVQEKSVKDAVSAAYKKIFFESSRYDGKTNRDSLVITNFINFVQTASIGESLSLEKVLSQFLSSGDFTKDMERELWARYTGAKRGVNIEDSIAAIQLLGLLATSQPDIIEHNLQFCVQYGLASSASNELESRLVRETCIAIRKSLPRKIEDKQRKPLRLSRADDLFTRLETILVESLLNMDCKEWFSMCDEAIRIIFEMAEQPNKICESIFKQLTEELLKHAVQSTTSQTQENRESPDFVFQPSTIQTTNTNSGTPTPGVTTNSSNQTQCNMEMVNPIALARFIHFLGDVALNLAVFLETHVLIELKLRNLSLNDSLNGSKNNISTHNISISSRRRSRRYLDPNQSSDDLAAGVGLEGAEAEDAEMEFVGKICDEEIVCGKSLLANLSPVIIEIATDPFRYPNPELKLASSLALAKFMMVSAKYCNKHLRLLFTILEKTKDNGVRINLLVAIGDLCIRFPNQLDSWTGKIFDCLTSEEVAVRRVALKIISRLVLCDILKPKDSISNMANLIVDTDEQLASFSRHFFLELSKKQNAIYNILPDIISRLSDPKTGINEDNFRIVMKFMFELIDKSTQIHLLVNKLCGRFLDTDNERQWTDLAFCLSLLKYSDASMIKLIDNFHCYKDKLCIDSVRESISLTVANYSKTPGLKEETKDILAEFEAKIAQCTNAQDETEEVDMKDQDANENGNETENEV